MERTGPDVALWPRNSVGNEAGTFPKLGTVVLRQWAGSRLPGELDGLEGSTKWRDLINKLCIWTQSLQKLAIHGSFRVGINTKSILSKELLAEWIREWKGGVGQLACPGSLTRKIWHPSCPFSMQYPAGRCCSVSALIISQTLSLLNLAHHWGSLLKASWSKSFLFLGFT